MPGTPDNTATLNTDKNDANQTSVTQDSSTQEIDWEKRYKDTQSAYTKTRQELIATKARATVLEEHLAPRFELSPEDTERLEDLKSMDPDAWRLELNKLENNARKEHNDKVNSNINSLTELEKRQLVLEDFQESHPDFILTDDVIEYDVPPRITKKLEQGKVTFEEFLEEAYTYLASPKVVGGSNPEISKNKPNLNKAGGGSTPTNEAAVESFEKAYSKAVF
jgi:hypothetical protein